MQVRLTSSLVCGAVITCKNYDSTVHKPRFTDCRHYTPDMVIEFGNHCRVTGTWPWMWKIRIATTIRRVVPRLRKPIYRFDRWVHCNMWLSKRAVKKKWGLTMVVYKFFCLSNNWTGCIGISNPVFHPNFTFGLLLMPRNRMIIEAYFISVPPQTFRIETMCNCLAVISKKEIKSLFVWVSCTSNRP